MALSQPLAGAPALSRARRWALLFSVAAGLLLVTLDNSVLYTALPTLTEELSASAGQALWIINAYPLVMAGLLLGAGTLGDRIGHRRMFLIGVVVFGIASLGAAFAGSAAQLIAARAFLAVGAAAMMPATLALIGLSFHEERERNIAIAIWGSVAIVGAALGPIIGGWLLQYFWWGSVFLVNVPVMAALLAVAPMLLPESRTPAPGSLDLLGVALSLPTMVAFVLAVKTLTTDAPLALAELAVAVAGGVAFVARARARRAAGREPLLDVTLFASPLFRLAALANATTMFAYTGLLFLLAQDLQLVAGLSPLHAGLLLVPGSVVTMVAGVGAARLARHAPFRVLVPAGLLLAAVGFAAYALESGPGVALLASVLVGAGIGLSETLTNDAILAAAPAERAGSASAVSETAYEVGSVLGTAVLGTVLGAAYAAALAVPTSIGPAFADEARETLGGAVGLAGRVGGGEGATLRDAATAAFGHGATVTSAVAAAVLAAVAAVVVAGLRRR